MLILAGKFTDVDRIADSIGSTSLDAEPLSDQDIELMKGAPIVVLSDYELDEMLCDMAKRR